MYEYDMCMPSCRSQKSLENQKSARVCSLLLLRWNASINSGLVDFAMTTITVFTRVIDHQGGHTAVYVLL